jgi:hypothetical protein
MEIRELPLRPSFSGRILLLDRICKAVENAQVSTFQEDEPLQAGH